MKEIRKIIREEIERLMEDFNFDNSHKSYNPPQDVISSCQEALSSIEQNNLTSHGGNEGSGEKKARAIVNKEPLNHSMLKRMKAFFDSNKAAVDSEKSQGKSINDSGLLQTWGLWGGDAAMRWVEREIGHQNQRNLSRKGLRRDAGMEKTSTLMDPTNIRIKTHE